MKHSLKRGGILAAPCYIHKYKMKKSPDDHISQLKNIIEKEQQREISWEEAAKAYDFMEMLVQIGVDITLEECRREDLLKQSPRGFHLDKSVSCRICGESAIGENSWYDKYGPKCITCQKAVDKKLVPGSIIKDNDSYYTSYEMEFYFNLKTSTLRKWIKAGIIKDRIIPGEGKSIHRQLFLISDNNGFLPSKNLLCFLMVKEIIDGKEMYSFYPWYYFVDPIQHLKDYKISDYFKVVLKDEEEK